MVEVDEGRLRPKEGGDVEDVGRPADPAKLEGSADSKRDAAPPSRYRGNVSSITEPLSKRHVAVLLFLLLRCPDDGH